MALKEGFKQFVIEWTVLFIILVVFASLLASRDTLNAVDDMQTVLIKNTQDTPASLKEAKYVELEKHIVDKNALSGYSHTAQFHIVENKNQMYYSPGVNEPVDYIYLNCDVRTFDCQEIKRNANVHIEEQVSLSNVYSVSKLINSSGNTILVLLPVLDDSILLGIPVFSALPQDLEITKELNKQSENLCADLFSTKYVKITDPFEKIILFSTGYFYAESFKEFALITKCGLDSGNLRKDVSIAEKEYASITNKNSVQERITEYNSNIEKYYPQVSLYLEEPKKDSPGMNMSLFLGEGHLFLKSSRLILYKSSLNLLNASSLLLQIRKESIEKPIVEAYKNKDVAESDISKAIRLKILQTRIYSALLDSCRIKENLFQKNQCIAPLIDDFASREFCDRIKDDGYVELEDCYSKIKTN